jgi:hypothetical protein
MLTNKVRQTSEFMFLLAFLYLSVNMFHQIPYAFQAEKKKLPFYEAVAN